MGGGRILETHNNSSKGKLATISSGHPRSSKRVANFRLNQCGLIRSSIPAKSTYFSTRS